MVIVDSTVWIDYLLDIENPETAWLEREVGRQRLGLVDFILCEVLQGVRSQVEFQRVRRELSGFKVFDTGGEALAVTAAEHYRVLRGHGHTVRKTIDCLIATFCIREGHALLHRDRDFEPFERHLGLRVIHA